MRFFGLGGQAMEKLGVSVSLLPGTEIFSALKKKDIDATEYSMPAIDQKLGLYKVAKYNYFPGWHQQATVLELLINKNVWNQMSDRQRMLLEVICKAATADSLAHTEAIQAKAMIDNAQNHGVRMIYWSEKMLDEFKKAWEEVAGEQAGKDPFFKKVWEDLEAFRSQYNIWKTYGFLPRPKPPRR
jgi:TRAP-type mannitol/chloroaromatic compound transport system substrate-binding protein